MPGEFYVSIHRELITTTLGSCIAVCLRDTGLPVGGMNHFMLPDGDAPQSDSWEQAAGSASARYGLNAMEQMINAMLKQGARRDHLEAKVFGGARVLQLDLDIADRNIRFAKHYLTTEQLTVVATDVGGHLPRKVVFDPLSGKVRVRRLDQGMTSEVGQQERHYQDRLTQEKQETDIELF